MRHRSSSTSYVTGAAVYLGVVAAGLAPLMGWAAFCQARKRGRHASA